MPLETASIFSVRYDPAVRSAVLNVDDKRLSRSHQQEGPGLDHGVAGRRKRGMR